MDTPESSTTPRQWRVLCVPDPGDEAPWCAALQAPPASAWGPFAVERCADGAAAAERLAAGAFDAVLAGEAMAQSPALAQAGLGAALLVVCAQPAAAEAVRLLGLGAQEVLPPAEAQQPGLLGRSVRLAIERQRLDREARKAYATDLATGLPNHAQLVEHMSHLLALREREPAPMALLVLRLEGLSGIETQLGRESAQVLRRKVAVRLRAGVRASDVVASLGVDAFAVLLSAIEEAAHAQRVVQKLVHALQQPFTVAGRAVGVAVGAGAALYPADGKQADALLRRASGEAALAAAVGRAGLVPGAGGGRPQAANDDDASVS